MSKIYRILLIISMVSFLYTFSTIVMDVVDMSIPNLKATIEIEDWDRDRNVSDVYEDIREYAQNNNLDIHKLVFGTDSDNNPVKRVFTFSKSKTSDYFYDENIFDSEVEFYDSSELTTENIRGSYSLTSNLPDNVKEDFANLGLTVTIEKFHISSIIFGSLFTTIGILSLVLLSATSVTNFIKKTTQLKKYGVWELSGNNVIILGVKDFLFDFAIGIFILIIFRLMNPILTNYYKYIGLYFGFFFFLLNIFGTVIVNKQETIVAKIKGNKPYQRYMYVCIGLKVMILFFCIITFHETIEQVNESKMIYQGISVWEKIDDYYQLYFSNNTTLLPAYRMADEDFAIANKKMYPLIENGEYNNGILAMKGEMETIRSMEHVNANPLLTVNHNFLDVIPVLNEDGDIIKGLSESKFYCLIPENHKSNESDVIDEMRRWIYFNQEITGDIDGKYDGELEIIYTQPNQKIFNFNSEKPQNSFSENPIIVVVYLQGLGSQIDNLIAEMSQGNYLFNNREKIGTLIQQSGLGNEFFGLVSVKDLGMNILQQIKREYRIKIITLVFLLMVFMVIQFFISYSYVELEKKKIFLEYIVGKDFIHRHQSYLKVMLLVCGATSLIAFLINVDYLYIVAGSIILEILILFSTIVIAEKSIRLNVIKKEV